MIARCLTLCALLLTLVPNLSAQTSDPPDAPLPSALSKATHIFIGNAGDQENDDCLRAYKTFYAGVSALTRLQLVADPSQADLALELHYEINLGQAVASGDSNKSVRQFRVVFLDPHSRIVLWSVTERTNYAAFKSNRNKNLDETVARLIGDVGSLLAEHPVPPNNDSRVKHGLAGLH